MRGPDRFNYLNIGLMLFSSGAGLIVMRWHEVGAKRLTAIGAVRLASVGLYLYDYAIGFKWLFVLSVTHIYLKFPLNRISIIGTFRDARAVRRAAGAGATRRRKKPKGYGAS